MGYEIYQREVTRVSTPAITLNARGRLVFNVAATKIIHEAGVDNVFLLWDQERRKFAVKATAKKDHRTVRVRYAANNKWAAISAKGFLQHIGHDVTKTVSLTAVWNDQENMFEVAMPEVQEEPSPQPELTLDRAEPKRRAVTRPPGARQLAR